jgi:hypothetical protein
MASCLLSHTTEAEANSTEISFGDDDDDGCCDENGR